ncbi:hypothetical protein PCASD_25390 [Puccinia coronata f. sp. avenae]|uniref:Uncharacterized protein n=1 Tax=Puccinia coronata f. sp. avenae TaxID=200324 RepID=A0A2N5SHQ9_9BASI|nr:hypothetical protein PCASD_25390 [Puccinia coronata f. sp. avenae]
MSGGSPLFTEERLAYHKDKTGSDYSTYEISKAAAVTSLSSRILTCKASDFNLDSGCLFSMKPFHLAVNNPKEDEVSIRLANNTVVNSTHSG